MTRVIWNWASCVFIGLLSDSQKDLKCQCQTLRQQQRHRTVFGNFRLQRISMSLLLSWIFFFFYKNNTAVLYFPDMNLNITSIFWCWESLVTFWPLNLLGMCSHSMLLLLHHMAKSMWTPNSKTVAINLQLSNLLGDQVWFIISVVVHPIGEIRTLGWAWGHCYETGEGLLQTARNSFVWEQFPGNLRRLQGVTGRQTVQRKTL